LKTSRAAIEPAAACGAVRSVSRSHVGTVRQINEDRLLDTAELGLWAIADGMGGHHGGDVAAQSVISALRRLCEDGERPTPAAIARSLEGANAEIFARGEGAGATVVSLSIQQGCAHILWAGDSRCYHIRDGVVRQLTKDHSVVQELVDAGLITAAAATVHPQSNVITRALGIDATCEVDSCMLDLKPFDRFLLCSDGLSRSLLPADLRDDPIDLLADMLLGQALARDGTDNISLVLVALGQSTDTEAQP
jgi:serine/threonine protein phosphatase PrpC